jgi:hypothetical protein
VNSRILLLIEIVDAVREACSNVYAVKDLPDKKIIHRLVKKISGHTKYLRVFEKAVHICCKAVPLSS